MLSPGRSAPRRDLPEPETILKKLLIPSVCQYTGHVALFNFWLCKSNMNDSDLTIMFCGTPKAQPRKS